MSAVRLMFVLPAILIVGACSSSAWNQDRPSQATDAHRQALESLKEAYRAGQYGDVIRASARSDTLATAPDDIKVEALKLEAFSYCVTDHRALCEARFARILTLQPDFALTTAEQGHPQWQPAFDAAKQR